MNPTQTHYQNSIEPKEIIQRLKQAYPDGPTLFHLAPIDQLHTGGIKASFKIAKQISLKTPQRVLDIGSGLGGLARVCLSESDIDYVCLDFTQHFGNLNKLLNQLSNQPKKPLIVTGDGQHLPFADNLFDIVLLQHSLVNMPDKTKALHECHRVLKPDGILMLHEIIIASPCAELVFPLPWASDAGSSHLASESELTSLITASNFDIEAINDCTEEALMWRLRQDDKKETTTKPVVSPSDILGSNFSTMAKNLQLNLSQNKLKIIELLARKM